MIFNSLLFQILPLVLVTSRTFVKGNQLGTPTSFEAPMFSEGHLVTVEPFWLEAIKHQGKSAYNPDPAYRVFRNVRDFGARGDGLTDDTAAINLAISFGNRCGGGIIQCNSSTITPALVYFPSGTYLVSTPINVYYYTQLIGDAKQPPIILASSSFEGLAVIDADPYIPGGNGAQWYGNTNNFFRSIRNFVVDLRRVPAEKSQGTGIHWQVAQATSLMNIVFEMSADPLTAHQGIWMENGSGGFMGDLVFNGGKYGMWVGNQQFTVRNITINNAKTAIFSPWNWGWTFQGVTISNCNVGFDLLTGGTQAVGGIAILDAVVNDTPIFIRSSTASNGTLTGSLVLNNIRLNHVPIAIGIANGSVVLPGGSIEIESWGQGNVYVGADSKGKFTQGPISAPYKPSNLLDNSGRIFGKMHPQYAHLSVNDFVSVRDHGATGDGVTDDTAAIIRILNKFCDKKVIFFDAGTYIITSTVTIPAGTRVVGEAWSVIAGSGSHFQDQNNPRVMIKVGERDSVGIIEISDIIFSTVGPAAGAIVVEWNVREPEDQQGAAGMWDSHIRLGGAAGTRLEFANCSPNHSEIAPCMAAYLALHLTPHSSAYLEGTWVWLADHDLDGDGASQISLYSGRGILSESVGPVWLVGTACKIQLYSINYSDTGVAEHHVLYQYRLVQASNHYMGLIQTESPYYQPSPAAPSPFTPNKAFKDPGFPADVKSAWGLSVKSSENIIVFGAGLYSFFDNYTQSCITTRNCQSQMVDIDSDSQIVMYSLSTVSSTFQISLDGKGVVNQVDNINGFASTVTAWTPC